MLVAWLPDATSHTQATPQVPVTNISDNVKTVEKKTSVGAKQGNILTFLKPAQAKPEKKGKGKAGHLCDQPEKTATKRSAENAELTLDDKEQVAPKKPASKRKFLQQWQEEFTWVVFDKDDNKMTCKICCAFPHLAGKTEFVSGCRTFKKETLQKHNVGGGHLRGVAALLRRDVTYLIDFHCLPHRLELALLEMQRSCRQVEIIYEVLQMIWKTYHYSPKSTRELQAIGNELGVSVLKPTQVSGTRWLPHISRALKVLITPNSDGSGQYAAVLCHMEHLSATSKNADIKGRAKFVSEKMRSVSFAAFCHFLADMFAIIFKLSLKMQRNDLILPVAVALLHETIANVDALKLRPVPNGHLKRFMNMDRDSE